MLRSSFGRWWKSDCSSSSSLHDVNAKPLRPVAAQLAEIIEVHQPGIFQIIHQRADQVVGRQWSDYHEASLHPKLLIGEIEARIDIRSHETHLLIRCFPNKDRWSARVDRDCHC